MARPSRSLIAIVSRRIVLFTVLAMVLQFGLVLAEYWYDESALGRFIIQRETARLATGIHVDNGMLTFDLPEDLESRYETGPGDDPDSRIYLRVRTASGAVLFSSCGVDCQAHFLPVEIHPPNFWQRDLAPGKPVSVAGGQSFTVDGRSVFVELAVIRDPKRFVYAVLFHELRDHLVTPMLLMFGLVVCAAILSVRSALRPVVEAARAADRIFP